MGLKSVYYIYQSLFAIKWHRIHINNKQLIPNAQTKKINKCQITSSEKRNQKKIASSALRRVVQQTKTATSKQKRGFKFFGLLIH